MTKFAITGHVNGLGERTIKWDDVDLFDDPGGLVQLLIDRDAQIRATPTGPTYTAADTPVEVALATARAVFDTISDETGDKDIMFDPTLEADAIA